MTLTTVGDWATHPTEMTRINHALLRNLRILSLPFTETVTEVRSLVADAELYTLSQSDQARCARVVETRLSEHCQSTKLCR